MRTGWYARFTSRVPRTRGIGAVSHHFRGAGERVRRGRVSEWVESEWGERAWYMGIVLEGLLGMRKMVVSLHYLLSLHVCASVLIGGAP